jgi:hypothetical protein
MNSLKHWFAAFGVNLLLTSLVVGTPPGFIKSTIPLSGTPIGIAFDAEGSLYALENASFGSNLAMLRTIAPDGTPGASFPVVGSDPSNFFIGGVAYDTAGTRLLVTDNTADGRIYAVSSLGNQQTIATGIAGIAAVAVRSTGEIFVSTAPFDSEGAVLEVDRATGAATTILDGLGFGAGLAFDANNDLIVQDANATTFAGRLQRLPLSMSPAGLVVGSPVPVLEGMRSSAGVVVAGSAGIFTTGNGGLFRISGSPPAEVSFDSNGSPTQFATAIAFDAGASSFERYNGQSGGRLAYVADFSFQSPDTFVTLLTPAAPGDYNTDGHVDVLDYALWRGAFGTDNLAADGNRDERVDAADYILWRQHADTSQGNAVPEPTVPAMLVMTVIPALTTRSRRGLCRPR